MFYLLLIFILIINVSAFLLMKADKHRAVKRMYRIKERTLWNIALCGGAIGAAFGMYLFRHKTKHLSFRAGFPVLAIIEAILYIYLIKWSYHFSFFDKL